MTQLVFVNPLYIFPDNVFYLKNAFVFFTDTFFI